jgi:hypothetical protein
VTVHPERLALPLLEAIDVVVATGDDPKATLTSFAELVGEAPPSIGSEDLTSDKAVFWERGEKPVRFRIAPSRAEHHRHRRKYAEGELGPDKSFYFRGPQGRLALRAQNLSCSSSSPRASTTRPGSTTFVAATTRAGSATRSKTRSWPRSSRSSNTKATRPSPRVRSSAPRSRSASPPRHRSSWLRARLDEAAKLPGPRDRRGEIALLVQPPVTA